MAEVARSGLRLVAVWFVLLAATMIGGFLIAVPQPEAVGDGPFGPLAAFLIVNAAAAAVLAALATRLSGTWLARAVLLFVLLFCVETLLSLFEALFFASFVGMAAAHLAPLAMINAIKSAIAAPAIAFLCPGPRDGHTPAAPLWTLPLAVLLYVFCYFAAGYLIAWQSEVVRTYYRGGASIDQGRLFLVQLGRGAIWVGLALLLLRRLRASLGAKALLTGIAFAVLMAAPLLFPNPYMPWAVRRVHLVELAVSNFLFGTGAIFLLGWKRRKTAA